MTTYNNNTTTYTTNSITTNIVNSYTSYYLGMFDYQRTSYIPLSMEFIKKEMAKAQKARAHRFVFKAWFKSKPLNEPLTNESAVWLHDYQSLLLAEPMAYGLTPIIDNLAMTIDVDDDQLSKFEQALKRKEFDGFKIVRKGHPKYLDDCKEQYERFVKFSFGENRIIFIFWALKDSVRAVRANQRLMKISFNPARFTIKEIKSFFKWFKKAKICKYKTIMSEANVTRIDTAFDLPGIHAPNLIIDKPNVQYIDYIVNNINDGEKVLGTLYLGKQEDSHLTVYDKSIQLQAKENHHISLMVYKTGQYIQMTRVERVYKPADGKAICLAELESAPYFLSDSVIYSPTILRELTKKERKLVREHGFSYWLYYECKRKNVILSLLERYKMYVNNDQLKLLQRAQLRQLKNIILSV